MTDVQFIGQEAEEQACVFLQIQGLKLLVRNYHCPLGEIDLIMLDQQEVIFIEVRKRSHRDYANPLESITPMKQKKIIKTALHYLQKQRWFDKVHCRFDVIGISHNQCEWIKDAFSVNHF